jgi:fucose permease
MTLAAPMSRMQYVNHTRYRNHSQSPAVVAGCYAGFFVLGIAGAMVCPAKDVVTRELGMQIEQGGLLVAAQFLGAGLGIYLGGRLADCTDIRSVLCGAGSLMVMGLVLFGVSRSFSVFVVAELLMGLGMGGWSSAPNLIIAKSGFRRPSVGLNLLGATWGMGSALGPQVVDLFLSRGNLALGYYAMAALTGLLLPLFWSTPLRLGDHYARQQHGARTWQQYLPFALIFILYVGAESGFGAWVFTQLTVAGNAPIAQGALAASLFWAGLTCGRMAAVVLLRHIGERRLLFACALTMAGGALTLVVFPHATAMALGLSFAIGLACGPIPTTYGLIVRSLPATSSTTLATLQAVGTCGGALVPPIRAT